MDMNSLMQHAQQMQQKMGTLQEELKKKTTTGSAGGGMVTVIVNGKSEVLSIDIEESVLSGDDKAMLQDLIVSATNDALRKAKELGKAEMSKLTGGLNIPGISNIFS